MLENGRATVVGGGVETGSPLKAPKGQGWGNCSLDWQVGAGNPSRSGLGARQPLPGCPDPAPLSTQGPEFVRKHIFNKHAEKIEEVKKEVAFFNNFLTDAKRPALPEIKPAQPPGPAQSKIRSMKVACPLSLDYPGTPISL